MSSAAASAPGRVNLIGEHLDYNGGRCLPIALPRRTTVTVRPARPGAPGPASSYVRGVLAALGVDEPLEVEIDSDVPIGAGLSSSGALTCATALAVDALLGLARSRDELVAACVRAENEYVGAPTGGLDQTIALHARAGHALLLDFADGSRRQVPFEPAAARLTLLVVDTGVRHDLADGQYGARRAECERAARELGVPHLAGATDPAAVRDPVLRRRARHVISEQARVDAFVAALAASDWPSAGALLTASHESLRDDFEVSCPELDTVVSAALAAGALGARMTGGGFGGSAVVLVPDAAADPVEHAVRDGFERNGWEAPTVFAVEASGAAEVLRTAT